MTVREEGGEVIPITCRPASSEPHVSHNRRTILLNARSVGALPRLCHQASGVKGSPGSSEYDLSESEPGGLCAVQYTTDDAWPILLSLGVALVGMVMLSVPETHHPEQNHILAALPPAERERLFPHLQLVPMPLGKVLYESGEHPAPRLFSDRFYRVAPVRDGGRRVGGDLGRSATRASSASRCSWAVRPRRAARSCRVPAPLTG